MSRYLKYGLILGVISLVSFLAVYFLNKGALMSSTYIWLSLFLMVAILVYAMLEERKEKGGWLDYGDRFKICFLASLISTFFVIAVQMILFKTDAEYRHLMTESQINTSLSMTKFFTGFKEEPNKYDLEEMRLDLNDQFSNNSDFDPYSGSMLFATLFNIILYLLVFSLITSFFVGQEKMSFRERLRRIDL